MPAETLNCPMCGAPTASDATRCEHCGARLATVACPSCFGMIFQGAKFCPHCGTPVQRTEVETTSQEKCPRCRTPMNKVLIGKTELCECPRCEGIWADAASLNKICADREEQAAVLGVAGTLHTPGSVELEQQIRYVPCPVCGNLMNRVNFAHCSNVIVDVCSQHGTWFDRDELRKIVEFIRAGGLEQARAREVAELEERRRQLSSAQSLSMWDPMRSPSGSRYADWHVGISSAASVLKSLWD